MKKNSLAFLFIVPALLFLFTGHELPAQATTIEVSGEISSDTIWDADTVRLTGHVRVLEGAALHVNPGTFVTTDSCFGIFVFGYLKAVGAEGDSIIFTRPVADTTEFFESTDTSLGWRGINFLEAGIHTDTSRLEYCKISFVAKHGNLKDTELNYYRDGAVYLSGGHKLRMENSLLSYNRSAGYGGGICAGTAYNGRLEVIDTRIDTNKAEYGGGIYARDHKDFYIFNSELFSNIAYSGGGIFLIRCKAEIDNNRICNNYTRPVKKPGTLIGGAGIYSENNNIRIANNVITNNTAYYWGGGLIHLKDNAELINNTVCNNQADNGSGGSFYLEQSVFRIFNSILWGNGASNLDFDNNLRTDFLNCNIEGGIDTAGISDFTGTVLNCIDAVPGFENPSAVMGLSGDALSADWSLKDISPAINTGTSDVGLVTLPERDFNGRTRVLHGEVDMGAFEKHIQKVVLGDSIHNDTILIADTIVFTEAIRIPDTVTLRIAPGSKVFFPPGLGMDVRGNLLAEGTPEDSILFTITDSAGFWTDTSWQGTWDGIYFQGDSSLLDYCRLIYGREDLICIAADDIFVRNTVVEHSKGSYALISVSTAGYSLFENCTFRNNRVFDEYSTPGMFDLWGGRIDLNNCIITDNNIDSTAVIVPGEGTITISNCHVSRNTGSGIKSYIYSKGPIVFKLDFNSVYVFNSEFSNNLGAGIKTIRQMDSLTVSGCLIVNNGSAIEINDYLEGRFINNTFMNNLHGISSNNAFVEFGNNILAGNRDGQISLLNTKISMNNSLVEGGIDSLYFDYGYIVDFDNMLDTLPSLVNPSPGSGPLFPARQADWSLNALSPCYDAGSLETNSYYLRDTDLSGNPRVHGAGIDMGALEHQGMELTIAEQPVGGTFCNGDSIRLKVSASDTVRFQWIKDGKILAGEQSPELLIDSATYWSQGVYSCNVSNMYGEATSKGVNIQVIEHPLILQEPLPGWVPENSDIRLSVYSRGTSPEYRWFKDDTLITGGLTPDLDIKGFGPGDEGLYTCVAGNSCGSDTSVAAALYMSPQLCMVTVSPTTGHNLVVWEKNTIAPIFTYKIYRESVAAGIYDLLETVPYDNLSVFVDTVADPTAQAYLYKVTAVDTAGFETDIDLCKPHKTIHLIVSTNPELNSTQLQWDRYYGFEYNTYTIYRSSTGLDFDQVHSMSASLNSWTDPDASTGDLFYRIAVERPVPCIPEGGGIKAGTGPFQHAISNMDDNKLKAGQLPPDTITISANTITEENLPGAVIGKLFTADADTLDSHTYKFVPGEGDSDNISFTIAGDLLMASVAFDYETKSSYTVRIRSTDEAGNHCEVPFTILVVDIDETTGLAISRTHGMSIYPNPMRGSATLRFPDLAEPYRLTITDLSGKLCRMEEILSSPHTLQKENLNPGVYILELRGRETFRMRLMIE